MNEKRTKELLRKAIELLESRVFDNYETEAMDRLGMTMEEYKEVTEII